MIATRAHTPEKTPLTSREILQWSPAILAAGTPETTPRQTHFRFSL
jgi:hypothetical protein